MSDFEPGKLRALGEAVPPGERTPELEALVGFATTMEDAEGLLKAAAARRKRRGDKAPSEALEPDAFEARQGLKGIAGVTIYFLDCRKAARLRLPPPPPLAAASAAAVAPPPLPLFIPLCPSNLPTGRAWPSLCGRWRWAARRRGWGCAPLRCWACSGTGCWR